ncbi:MAG: ROK family protein [Ahrensia sp.]|nr:ROK family protein [Ahrensia sp.]
METPHTSDSALILEQLYDKAKQGDDAAKAIFSRAGRYLAAGLANIVNLFDPSLVILSGARMQYDYLYADDVLQEMQKQTLNWERTSPIIEIHAWGDLLWAQGAAALAMSELTEKILGNSQAA